MTEESPTVPKFEDQDIQRGVWWINSSDGTRTIARSEIKRSTTFFLLHHIQQSNYQQFLGDIEKRLGSGIMC